MDPNVESIMKALKSESPMSARQIKKVTDLEKSEINRILYKFTTFFKHTKVGSRPMWENADEPIVIEFTVTEPPVTEPPVTQPDMTVASKYKVQMFECLTLVRLLNKITKEPGIFDSVDPGDWDGEADAIEAYNNSKDDKCKIVLDKLANMVNDIFSDKAKISDGDYVNLMDNAQMLKEIATDCFSHY